MSKTIIFDTETTGLNKEDEIIQIGAMIIDPIKTEDVQIFDDLFSSNKKIDLGAMATHGIRDEMLKNKQNFEDSDFLQKLNELNNKENYLIAHNLNFDLSMIEKYNFKNNFQLIDTLQCAKHLYEIGEEVNSYKIENYKLQSFRYMLLSDQEEKEEEERYKLSIKAHDAIGDVLILKLFLRKILQRVSSKYDIKKYVEIMSKLVELTKTPVTIKIMPFGKHRGKSLQNIYNEDMPYLQWLFKEQKKQKKSEDAQFNNDLYFSLEKFFT